LACNENAQQADRRVTQDERRRNLAFQDRLRTSIEDRRRYEDLKRALAKIDWPDMNAYADAKAKLIEEIIAAATASDGP
jgi:GrpB-like predicted nucleotidyltransferase (UPF0157 family)